MIKIGDMFFPDGERHFQAFGDAIADYQRPQREYAFQYVTSWEVALDLGANVGIFSRHFAERFTKVIAVEPLVDNVECLRLNVPGNVEIIQTAVGDRAGTVRIYKTPKGLGGAFVSDHEDVERPNIPIRSELLEEVPMVTVDSLKLQHVGLVKLDLQGSELIALRGAAETLRRCRPVTMIEEKPLGGQGGSMQHVFDARALLLELGYTMAEMVGADRIYRFA